tara:strand:- start:53 stop:424 length:372 start_codon:yes stop_codon:yes gene_type:complete
MKNKKQEYENIIKYCSNNNRAVPLDWCKVMTILEIQKLPERCRGPYHSLVLAYHSRYNINQKIKRFHRQIAYGLFNSDTSIYNKLKDFLMNLKRNQWLYKQLNDDENEIEGFNMYATKSRLHS